MSCFQLRRIVTAALLIFAHGSLAVAQQSPILERREVRVDGHPLTVWSKRPATPARGAILLIHGRTWSSRPNFDLQVPGLRVSLMDALVARGYAVYALDQRGYGGTPRDETGFLTPSRADADASAVLDWVSRRESRPPLRVVRPALLGYSRGAAVAMLVAQRHPEKLSALVLYGFPRDLAAPRMAVADPATPARQRTTPAAAGEDFITPQSTPPGVKEAYVKMATTMDTIRVDWRGENEFGSLEAQAVRTPTLVIYGERDPYASRANLAALFTQLGTADRWWVVLPAADHAAHLETQTAFVNALVGFLERGSPAPRPK